MTPPLATVTGTHDVLAGFELSPGAVVALLGVVFAAAVLGAGYLALFTGYLVSSAQRLHRDGRLAHPWLAVCAVIITVSSSLLASGITGALLLAVGLGGGYAIMLRCGQAWFRWTVVPVLPLVALASVVR